MKAKLSILGLYRWNKNIFQDMALPPEVDREVVTWQILEDCGELEILYSDPDFMQKSIQRWSMAMLPNWQKIVAALTAEYNPIWNKDGTIRETITYGTIEQSGSGNGSGTNNERDKVAGFNSDTTHEREERSSDSASTTTTQSRQEAHTDTTERIEQGNIGVTESSAMVRHEVELRAEYNIYQIIADDFKRKYCLMVY